ncbi:MAG: deoxyribodipyrimidine photo-lyase [Spirochaetota bacterium]
MSSPDPFADRVAHLNDAPFRDGRFVLYWMQRSRRARYNHALELAVKVANERGVPVVVAFGLAADYPEASERHYRFMLEGLRETAAIVRERGIGFVVRIGEPQEVALEAGRDAVAIVCDRGYLAHLRRWRYELARAARCRVIEVESDLVVPVEEASSKQEYAARTIRPRVHRALGRYLLPLEPEHVRVRVGDDAGAESTVGMKPDDPVLRGESLEHIDALLERLAPPAVPAAVDRFFRGGSGEARRRLDSFISDSLPDYEERRSEPGLDVCSGLSPYLHFGQISELEIALELGAQRFVDGLEAGTAEMSNRSGSVGMRTDSERVASSRDAFLEELLVRRGLAHNYVWYAKEYDRYTTLPEWARKTLREHDSDEREHVYSYDDLVAADTHDPYWNAAMREMLATGFMHNYMRMYWGKKVLEWTREPSEAFYRLLTLNNTWFLDGRDPNSYANVAWVFGLHDRPWTERPIFGNVRYMNANGLKRKFDMDAYLRKAERLEEAAR